MLKEVQNHVCPGFGRPPVPVDVNVREELPTCLVTCKITSNPCQLYCASKFVSFTSERRIHSSIDLHSIRSLLQEQNALFTRMEKLQIEGGLNPTALWLTNVKRTHTLLSLQTFHCNLSPLSPHAAAAHGIRY